MKLAIPSILYKDSYLYAIKEYHQENFLTEKLDYDEIKNNFNEYLKRIEDMKTGENVPPTFSPQSEFWLINEENEYVGTLKIRHVLNNPTLLNVGGHIGYFIRPSFRKFGYGSIILELGLKEAKQIGLEKILITCDETNLASKKIIEKNGGIFESIFHYDNKIPRLRYWISIT
ncbi:MAG: GNAT family N-acetyltransferase [Bacteroidota bacterium]